MEAPSWPCCSLVTAVVPSRRGRRVAACSSAPVRCPRQHRSGRRRPRRARGALRRPRPRSSCRPQGAKGEARRAIVRRRRSDVPLPFSRSQKAIKIGRLTHRPLTESSHRTPPARSNSLRLARAGAGRHCKSRCKPRKLARSRCLRRHAALAWHGKAPSEMRPGSSLFEAKLRQS